MPNHANGQIPYLCVKFPYLGIINDDVCFRKWQLVICLAVSSKINSPVAIMNFTREYKMANILEWTKIASMEKEIL